MHFRILLAAAPSLLLAGLVAGPCFAQNLDVSRSAAIARLKLQLVAVGPGFDAELQARPGAAPPASPDPVLNRLSAAFALVVPDLDGAAGQAVVPGREVRLPRPRPLSSDIVALAYVDAAPAEPGSTAGMTAIEALVVQHAEANDVPPALAQALVEVESSHDPDATGGNGEIGLLQIKPQTARAMGYKGPANALYDPETNLTWGMKYLAKAHDLAGGDVCGTLLRFNAGLDATRTSKSSSRFCRKVKSVMAERA